MGTLGWDARWTIAVLGILHSISSSGCLFGHPAFMIILKRNGHYNAVCESGQSNGECVEVDLLSARIYSVALAVQSVLALPLGLILDWLGPKGAILYQSICVLGGLLMVLSPPYSHDSADLIMIGFTLLSACGISIVTLHMHVSTLFSSSFLFCNITAATYVASTILYSVYEVLDSTGYFTFRGLLTFHTCFMGIFLLFSFLLPTKKFNKGDVCVFGRIPRQAGFLGFIKSFPFFGFHAIPKETSELTSSSLSIQESESVSSVKVVVTEESISHKTSHSSSHLSAVAVGQKPWKEFLRLPLFSRQFIFVSLAMVFWYYTVSFYMASVQLQLKSLGFRIAGGLWGDVIAEKSPELSSIDPALASKANTMARVFNFSIWTGCIFSISSGAIADRYGFPFSLIFQFILGMMHLIPQMIPNFEVQGFTFVGFSAAQDVMFALSCSYIGIRLGWKFQNGLVGLQMAICGLLFLTIEPIIRALAHTRTVASLFTPTLYTFFTLGLLSASYPVWVFRDERRYKRMLQQSADAMKTDD